MPANAEAPGILYWQIYEYPSLDAAWAESGRHRWSAVAEAHSRVWLNVLSERAAPIDGVEARAVIGPL